MTLHTGYTGQSRFQDMDDGSSKKKRVATSQHNYILDVAMQHTATKHDVMMSIPKNYIGY